jgi:hypothetical protein
MGSEPSDQVKLVYSVMQTLEQKSELVDRLQQDLNRMVLALGEAKKAQDNARIQLAAELEKLDRGLVDALVSRSEKNQRKAS